MQGGVVIFNDVDRELVHEVSEAAFVTEGVGESELGQMRGEGAGDAPDEVNATEWQLKQRKIATNGAEHAGD